MFYNFHDRIAAHYGLDEAVFINNIYFWVRKNEANKKHFYDGHYWTYNSMEAFTQIFDWWSRRQIERIVKSCKEKGLILVGNYNVSPLDRTQWYAITETVKSIYENGGTQSTERAYSCTQTVQAIPDNKPDSKPDSKPDKESVAPQSVVDKYNEICTKLPKCLKITDKRRREILRILKTETLETLETAFRKANESAFLVGENQRGWKANFDFLITESHLVKVLEGMYDNTTRATGKGRQQGSDRQECSLGWL